MIHAGTNFSHMLAFRKAQGHVLVTDGIYRYAHNFQDVDPIPGTNEAFSWFRHPSYAGFFHWALGTQLVLQNPVSFFFFAVVLWRFFNRRIRGEYCYI